MIKHFRGFFSSIIHLANKFCVYDSYATHNAFTEIGFLCTSVEIARKFVNSEGY